MSRTSEFFYGFAVALGVLGCVLAAFNITRIDALSRRLCVIEGGTVVESDKPLGKPDCRKGP